MRIIGGTCKGRLLQSPRHLPVRPTTDRTKEALFNWLSARLDFEQIVGVDLFSGTGNLALELASRGAKNVLAVDIHTDCINFIKSTAKLWQLRNVNTLRADVFKWLQNANLPQNTNLVLADPPYQHPSLRQLPDFVLHQANFMAGAWLVLEHPATMAFNQHPLLQESRKYGQSTLSFFQKI